MRQKFFRAFKKNIWTMPRMAPMNYRVDAKLKGDSYRAKMVLIMSGPWAIVTKITHQGKRHTVKVSIDVP